MTQEEKDTIKKQIIENYIGNGGNLTEEWWSDFFLGMGLREFSLGVYEITTTTEKN